MATSTADRPWIKKEKKAQGQGMLERAARDSPLVHDGPFLSIRQLHFELTPPPEGQGRYFLVTFKHPVRIQKVRTRIMESFGKMEDLKI